MPSQLQLSAEGTSIEVEGVVNTPSSDLILPLLPDVTRITNNGQKTLLDSRWGFGRTRSAALPLRATPTWHEVLYGALRYWHGAAHALNGRVVLDAALLVQGGCGLIVAGSGKSHFAAACAQIATVVSDDTVIVEHRGNGLVGTGWCRRAIRSRTGLSFDSPKWGVSSAPISAIAFVDGAYGPPQLDSVSETDAHSWLLQASIQKILNTRSRPASFAQAFIGSPQAARAVADRVEGWRIPAIRALGSVDPRDFWARVYQCAA
ncbi:hypothetical protein [Mycobacterium sp. SP-6446]|uniref:hypothetical protein n=1 Tax=Mycobacterium sp. SP-6446 TaxID=1834162 RepID=UPI00158F2BCE|nr:hypothetical protein [Mycobacterium sp. SP-6446]